MRTGGGEGEEGEQKREGKGRGREGREEGVEGEVGGEALFQRMNSSLVKCLN